MARRLRAFRELHGISRVLFALDLGIGSERLASYESGRVPLPCEVFQRLHSHFRISPAWLAESAGDMIGNFKLADGVFSELRPRARFSDVYSAVIKPRWLEQGERTKGSAQELAAKLEELAAAMKNKPDALHETQLEQLRAGVESTLRHVEAFGEGKQAAKPRMFRRSSLREARAKLKRLNVRSGAT